MKYLVLTFILLASSASFSQIDRKGNGGDICEDQFKIVRDDISSWIQKGGSDGLNLFGTSKESYRFEMQAQISQAKVSCTDGAILVQGLEKTCKNFLDQNDIPQIVCNSARFMATDDSNKYVLVHHEYAGLAGFEVNGADGSKYFLSNQITDYLEDQLVRKLAVKPSGTSSSIGVKATRSESIDVGAYTNVEKQFNLYKRILGRAGRIVRNIKLGDQNGFGHVFGISFDHLASRSLNCDADSQDIAAGAFEDLETKITNEFNLEGINDSQWIDVEIVNTWATGSISAVRIYYCK